MLSNQVIMSYLEIANFKETVIQWVYISLFYYVKSIFVYTYQ